MIHFSIKSALRPLGANGQKLSEPFMSLPNKKKCPDFHHKYPDALDLTALEKNIMTGRYTTVEAFDKDFLRMINCFQVSEYTSNHKQYYNILVKRISQQSN
jgi:hypothetical protein